ncbi:MAG: hypothetical protein ACRDKI_12440, partial [Solirubrobacterales bacterium]
MDPNERYERRRRLIIAIATGFFAACLVFVVAALFEAAQDQIAWILLLIPVLPLLIVLCQLSASSLRAALHPEAQETEPPDDTPSPK